MHDVQPQISVIIPCYHQAHYLGKAIESVLAQTYHNFEIIVIDDGSPDNTAEVAARYPEVRYIRQENQGLSGARNTGIRESRGKYLVFLDADDCLTTHALQAGVNCLHIHPECAFVSGHHRYIKGDGSLLAEYPQEPIHTNYYQALLQGNYIGMHATVMYQRFVFDEVGGFDTSLKSCEDYDLYLRIASRFPIYRHHEMAAEYRWHDANMTRNSKRMLRSALTALSSQWQAIQEKPDYIKAYKMGMRFWRNHFGKNLLVRIGKDVGRGSIIQVLEGVWMLPQYICLWMIALLMEYEKLPMSLLNTPNDPKLTSKGRGLSSKRLLQIGLAGLRAVTPNAVQEYIAHRFYAFTWPPVGRIDFGDLRQIRPLSETTPLATGMRIDQYYVESFLSRQADDIHGRVLELNSADFTGRFGGKRVEVSDICQMVKYPTDSASEPDLTLSGAVPADSYDCIIFPQALHRVYDLEAMAQALYERLQPGGVLLVTVPGMGLITNGDSDHAGYWSFTELAAQQLFARVFGDNHVSVRAYGNVLAATAFYHNLSVNELSQAELEPYDEQFQLLVSVRAIKCCATRPSPRPSYKGRFFG